MLWDINFLLFCVNIYIAKRHEETKKVEWIQVKTRLFSMLWKSLILLNSISRSFRKGRGAYWNDYVIQEGVLLMITADYWGWVVSEMAKKSDDIICERTLSP